MQNNLVILLLILVITVTSLPTTFDIRYQPDVTPFTSFQSSSDLICQSYNWAKQLTQIISNRISIVKKSTNKVILSAQQLAQCVQIQQDQCQTLTLKTFYDALKYIQLNGLRQQSCYRNNFFQLPRQFCRRKCTDGSDYITKYFVSINNQTDIKQLLTDVGNNNAVGFAIIQFYDQMNYYSSSSNSTQRGKPSGQVYTHVIAEIVGWKSKGNQINFRIGAPGWGFKGYWYLPYNSPIIKGIYSVRNIKMIEQNSQK